MSKIIKIEPPYTPLTQQKFCCVPCAIQWVLLRRGLKLISQEDIGWELRLTVPPKYKKLFGKVRVSKKKPKGGYGTQAESRMVKFFKKYKIPLKFEYYKISKIKDPLGLVIDNLKKKNDVIAITNLATFWPKRKFGHAMVISAVILGNKPGVILGDPSPRRPKFLIADFSKLIRGMSKKYDGCERGFWVFREIIL